MDGEFDASIAARLGELVRQAYEAGVRDGRAAAEARHAAALGRMEVAAAEGILKAGSESKVTARDGRAGNRRKDWGTARPAIYKAVAEVPGRTLQEILAASGSNPNTLRSTLWDFEREGYLRRDDQGRHFPIDPERSALAIQPRPVKLKDEILSLVRSKPGLTTMEIIEATGTKSTSVRATLYRFRDDGDLVGSSKGWSAPKAG